MQQWVGSPRCNRIRDLVSRVRPAEFPCTLFRPKHNRDILFSSFQSCRCAVSRSHPLLEQLRYHGASPYHSLGALRVSRACNNLYFSESRGSRYTPAAAYCLLNAKPVANNIQLPSIALPALLHTICWPTLLHHRHTSSHILPTTGGHQEPCSGL